MLKPQLKYLYRRETIVPNEVIATADVDLLDRIRLDSEYEIIKRALLDGCVEFKIRKKMLDTTKDPDDEIFNDPELLDKYRRASIHDESFYVLTLQGFRPR